MREDLAARFDEAIRSGDTAAVGQLLEAEPRLTGTPIPVPRDWGDEMWLGLHLAAELGGTAIVDRLLVCGASIDARTRYRTPMHARQTALMLASSSGQHEIVAQLLEHHAEASLLDANHRSALTFAAEAGHLEVITQLLKAHAPIDPVDDQQRTPLHWAIAGGHAQAALLLIESGADINHPCPKEPAGFTPLHRCITVGDGMSSVGDRLIAAGANETLRDPREGKTADDLRRESAV